MAFVYSIEKELMADNIIQGKAKASFGVVNSALSGSMDLFSPLLPEASV